MLKILGHFWIFGVCFLSVIEKHKIIKRNILAATYATSPSTGANTSAATLTDSIDPID